MSGLLQGAVIPGSSCGRPQSSTPTATAPPAAVQQRPTKLPLMVRCDSAVCAGDSARELGPLRHGPSSGQGRRRHPLRFQGPTARHPGLRHRADQRGAARRRVLGPVLGHP